MALRYNIQRRRLTGGGMASFAPRSANSTQTIQYDCHVDDDGGGDEAEPRNVTELMVLAQPELPVVNESIFSWDPDPVLSSDTVCSPWLICSSKRAERDPNNALLWRINCEYRSGNRSGLREEDLKLISLPTDVASYPFLVEKVWRGEDHVIWEEAQQPSNLPLRLPTGSLYSQPFMQRFSARTLRQHQFEVIADQDLDSTIEARLFSTNDIAFGGDPAPDPPDQTDANPPRWKIQDIGYQKMSLPLNDESFAPCYLMTYLLERNARDGGWWDRRALIDNYYLTTPDDQTTKKLFRDPTDQSVIDGLLDLDGTKLNDQAGNPEFINYTVQFSGNWGFLKT